MYIEPNTTIRFLKTVPLDSTYTFSLYFEDINSQTRYFQNFAGYTLENYSYQRVSRNRIRVSLSTAELYSCNYIMFKNNSFENKWFYAFIKSIEYVNNQCSEVEYQIDVMQTWFFDYTFENSFIERIHSSTDNIGDNILPEPLETGEYVFSTYDELNSALNTLAIIMLIAQTVNGQTYGTFIDGTYSGCQVWAFKTSQTGLNALNSKVADYRDAPESIVNIYCVPYVCVSKYFEGQASDVVAMRIEETSIDARAYSGQIQGAGLNGNEDLNGYVPRNKKLYTYPYNFYSITNGQGASLNARYEFFRDLTPQFDLYGKISQPVEIKCVPRFYKGSGNSGEIDNFFEGLTLANYPMCSSMTDAFAAWSAQSSVPYLINAGTRIGGGAIMGGLFGGGLIGAAVGAVGGLISTISDVLTQSYQASISADIVSGNFSNSGNVYANAQNFFGGRCNITRQYAEYIDKFFDMFGYAYKSYGIPNRNVRPHWTYLKTVGINLHGNVPADDMETISRIYDNGITFWRHGAEVGNYSLDNSPQ